jgi:hypothetical protein
VEFVHSDVAYMRERRGSRPDQGDGRSGTSSCCMITAGDQMLSEPCSEATPLRATPVAERDEMQFIRTVNVGRAGTGAVAIGGFVQWLLPKWEQPEQLKHLGPRRYLGDPAGASNWLQLAIL